MAKKTEQVEGTELIRQERMRQVAVEKWTAAHDDMHECGELADAAACYAATQEVFTMSQLSGSIGFSDLWPFDDHWDKRPRDRKDELIPAYKQKMDVRIRNLVKAGALIAAEIDRLERAKQTPSTRSE